MYNLINYFQNNYNFNNPLIFKFSFNNFNQINLSYDLEKKINFINQYNNFDINNNFNNLNNFNIKNLEKDNNSFNYSLKVSTISVAVKKNNKIYLLICRRGVMGINYGKIYTQGGSIDNGETPEEAAVRELYEEAGVKINISDLKVLSNYKGYKNFYVLLDNFPEVNGAQEKFKFEIIEDNYLAKKFNVSNIINNENNNTGLVWVEITDIIDEIKDESYYFKNIINDLNEKLKDN